MFTGLIQTLGTLTPLNDYQVQIICSPQGRGLILADLAIGDSVAVDGVCLTVETLLSQGFIAAVSPETLNRTTLNHRAMSQVPVNLETSLKVGSKLGGHFVTGHVDGTGEVLSIIQTAIAWEMVFHLNTPSLARYIVPKGSIAVNGISLTLAQDQGATHAFKVAVIPHTFDHTNLQYLHPGDVVNLEGDILGKYVEGLLRTPHDKPENPITADFLSEHGYGEMGG
ncbi:riboflavin synthase [Roseofilum reptotaenium CS-1145]|uniref:Riboflavin synthase n=1 Tax=Roseofilum reptotaenium AO1-A TaxID=1925591 RepID=A0A1L9QTM7_9CYAN|nr:riboflavin synthase [Roseofilum reptotaenium]MDB9518994.1 riboflavin synthase [Roseofilum reptotaenium CS-1145]OJJ25999.1 riboflavin synthase subunit alpha [Roseofilum reptotaenium AO1-A]